MGGVSLCDGGQEDNGAAVVMLSTRTAPKGNSINEKTVMIRYDENDIKKKNLPTNYTLNLN